MTLEEMEQQIKKLKGDLEETRKIAVDALEKAIRANNKAAK